MSSAHGPQRFIYMFGPASTHVHTIPTSGAAHDQGRSYYEAVGRAQRFENDLRALIREEIQAAGMDTAHREMISAADAAASVAHNAIYAEPFNREAASAAIWNVHDNLRPLIE